MVGMRSVVRGIEGRKPVWLAAPSASARSFAGQPGGSSVGGEVRIVWPLHMRVGRPGPIRVVLNVVETSKATRIRASELNDRSWSS
jgi:hypothetical protein